MLIYTVFRMSYTHACVISYLYLANFRLTSINIADFYQLYYFISLA